MISNFMWRRGAERVETEETDDHPLSDDHNSLAGENDDDNGEEGQFVGSTSSVDSVDSQATPMLVPDDEDMGTFTGDGDVEAPNNTNSGTDTNDAITTTTTASSTRRSGRITSSTRRTRVTLRDLEEERELVRRRTSACVLLSAFILLRLWIQAVVSGDFGLLLLCLVFTSWTARFIRHTREREEELDRLISEYDENAEDENSLNDARLRRMSFQSQLALAIMQSQMQMMQGGFGHPDGGGDGRSGVTDDAKSHWNRFEYHPAEPSASKNKGGYGSVAADDAANLGKDSSESSEEEPHCSICLCEYEEHDKLVSLPCKHIFHDDCISSWTDNNQRCPLCNYDLESVAGSGEDAV